MTNVLLEGCGWRTKRRGGHIGPAVRPCFSRPQENGLAIAMVVTNMRCRNCDEIGRRMVFVQSVRRGGGESDFLKVREAIEVWSLTSLEKKWSGVQGHGELGGCDAGFRYNAILEDEGEAQKNRRI